MLLVLALQLIYFATTARSLSNSTSSTTSSNTPATLSSGSTASNTSPTVSNTQGTITTAPTLVPGLDDGIYISTATPCEGVPERYPDRRNCLRSGHPVYSLPSNPFLRKGFDESENVILSSCDTIFTNAMNSWLETAPIVLVAPQNPQTTMSTSRSGWIDTLTYTIPTGTSSDSVSTAIGTYYFPHTPGGAPFIVKTITTIDAVGVQTVQPVTSDISVEFDMGRAEEYGVTTRTTTQMGGVYVDVILYTSAYYVSNFTYTPTGSCCVGCTLFGDKAQVFLWPTPAPSPPVSILVDSSNFTLFVIESSISEANTDCSTAFLHLCMWHLNRYTR